MRNEAARRKERRARSKQLKRVYQSVSSDVKRFEKLAARQQLVGIAGGASPRQPQQYFDTGGPMYT